MNPLNTTLESMVINVNNTSICYNDLGEGKIPIIFIHGFPFDKSSWAPQMEFFKKTQRVIAYDIRGFGKSASGKESMSIDLFADDLIKFMDALNINKAIVCGLSMGGYILLNAVNRYPEKFAAIILSDTQCVADSPELKENRNKSISHILACGLKDFSEGFVNKIFYKETLDTKIELVDKIRTIILSTSSLSIIAGLKALADRSEMCSSLNKISAPTLILCGKEDAITPLDKSEFLLEHIKSATLQIIDKTGHMPNLEQPDVFNQHIFNFINGLKAK